MKCSLCEDKLLEYLYGELSQEDASAMEKHLKESEPCREQARAFASGGTRRRARASLAVPYGFLKRCLHELDRGHSRCPIVSSGEAKCRGSACGRVDVLAVDLDSRASQE